MKWLLVLLAIVGAFWAGYITSSYRTVRTLVPELQRSSALSDASILLGAIELIDKGEIQSLRTKLLEVARAKMEPLPLLGLGWSDWLAVVRTPLEGISEPVAGLREESNHKARLLRAQFEKLCSASSDANNVTTVCGS